MKKKLVLFLSLFILMGSFVSGCSNNIKKIEIIEDSIKRNYIVGEDVDVNNFEIKVIYNNKKEELYYISEGNIKVDNIDNTKLGEQNLNVNFSYNSVDVNLQLVVNFDLPSVVKELINRIDELPNIDDLTFEYEDTIASIKDSYASLSDFYKNYVTNYDKLNSSDLYLKKLRSTYITEEFIEYRSNVKLSLAKYYSTLNKSDYYDNEWIMIGNIYNYGVSSLMNDSNYEIIDNIYASTISNMRNVNTAYMVLISNTKSEYINKLYDYRNSLDNSLYSDDNIYKLNLILNNGINLINNSFNEVDIVKNYNLVINEFNQVYTVELENEKLRETKVKENIYELNVYYINLDVSKYSDQNKNKIREKYLSTVNKINSALNEEDMKNYISYFKNYINLLYTIDEENIILIRKYKDNTISNMNDILRSINLYNYSTSNRNLIEKEFDNSLVNIELATSIEEIDNIVYKFSNFINEIPKL